MPASSEITRARAFAALALLTTLNFLNYIDRWTLAAVLPPIQAEFHLSDTALGALPPAFMLAYMLASPFFGPLADRKTRRHIVAGGVLVWSVATVLSGLARSYHELLAARACIGIGEAAYGTVAPTLIADLFPARARGRMLSVFYLAMPVGSALGFVLGGALGARFGWRTAFYAVGVPGVLAAMASLWLPEPRRGAHDTEDGVTPAAADAPPPTAIAVLKTLTGIPSYILATAGMAAMYFAMGGVGNWMAVFLVRVRGLGLAEANLRLGLITVAGGLVGTLLGGWLGDWLERYTGRAYLLMSGIGMLIGLPFAWLTIHATSPGVYLPALFVTEVCLFLNTGPIGAVLMNVVPPAMRGSALAVNIFFTHLVGDAGSPALIGWMSDRTSLTTALMMIPPAFAISGAVLLYAGRYLVRDTERVRAGWSG